MEFHPLADIFPLMEVPALGALGADIMANGLREPLVMYEGKLLDGRNRWCACQGVNVPVTAKNIRQFNPKKEGDPLTWIITMNLQRRHLGESQRAWVAVKVETLKHGGARRGDQNAEMHLETKAASVARQRASILMNVSVRLIAQAAFVAKNGEAVLHDAVAKGHITAGLAEKVIKTWPGSEADQAEVAALAVKGETSVIRTMIKQKLRRDKEAKLGAKIIAFPQKRYGVIGADPEWKFKPWSEAGMDRSAENHFPTSELVDIKARDVQSIAAADCVLFLWGTVPMTPQALEVMKAWGFKYVTNFVWVKDNAGTGYWNRNRHETLFVGVKGKPPAPAPGMQWDSVIEAPACEHSEKPEAWLELIEAYFPTLPKIELNRRGPARPGWDAWGNEVEPDQNRA